MATEKTTCPFCREEIVTGAAKCKHCGEWLTSDGPARQGAVDRGTMDARAVTKGIKQAEAERTLSDSRSTLVIVASLAFSVFVGYGTRWWAGVVLFLVLMCAYAWKGEPKQE